LSASSTLPVNHDGWAGFNGGWYIVTGATSGIGRACVRLLGQRGGRVIAVGRNDAALDGLTQEVGAGRVERVCADLTRPDAVARVVDAFTRVGTDRLDGLINAAGILQGGSILACSDGAFEEHLAINTLAPFRLIRAFASALAQAKGAVVNVSSVAGGRAFPGLAAYCISKAALEQLTAIAALDLAPQGVRVNAVAPGVVVTELHRRGGMTDAAYESFLEHSKTTHPLGRVGSADEVARLIAFLLSREAAWVTGACIPIDGGRSRTCSR
jgi:NAD(P)-dependent dehydrogenase (short-subunit alcohol dehydrogenase family)